MERAFVYGFEMIAVEELEEIRSSERAWLIRSAGRRKLSERTY